MSSAIDVFVSRPTWVHESFRKGLDVFLARLADSGLKPHTLGSTDYPNKAPLDEVINLMESCKGAVILGYPQLQVWAGTLKNAPLAAHMALPTEWNHIEAGLAYARKLPLLVVHHTGVVRGIFDRGALNCFLFAKDLTDPAWSVTEEISGAIRAWRDNVLGFAPTPKDERVGAYEELLRRKDEVWTAQALGRRITDPRPVGKNHRESAECRLIEVTEFYVRIRLLSSDVTVTVPIGDIRISFDEKRQRPMIELRA
jgi:hypothetical protein